MSRAEDKAATLARLRKAGREVLVEAGVARASIQQIAARAGIATGSFYVHFESKAAFIDSLIEELNQGLVARMLTVLMQHPPPTPTVLIEQLAETVVEYWAENIDAIPLFADHLARNASEEILRIGTNLQSVAMVQRIIAAVREVLPRNAGNRIIAQHTITVFETLNARPPGVLATISLLLLHGGAFLLVVCFGLLLVVNMHGGGLKNFFGAAVRQPRHSVSCGAWKTSASSDAANRSAAPRNLLVTSLATGPKAAAAYERLVPRVPADSHLTLCGDSLLLSLPASDDAARENWYAEFQKLSTDTFVVVSNTSANVSLDFIAPTPAIGTNLAEQLHNSLSGVAGMNLIMPWAPEAKPAAFAAMLRARQDWQHITKTVAEVWKDPKIKSLNKQIANAAKRGARNETARLQEQITALRKDLHQVALADLRTNSAWHVDPELIQLYGQLNALNYTNRTERKELTLKIAAKLGPIPAQENRPDPAARAYGASSGLVRQHGVLIEVSWLSLYDASVGLPALVDWLCQQNCRTIKYELHPGYLDDFSDEMIEDSP